MEGFSEGVCLRDCVGGVILYRFAYIMQYTYNSVFAFFPSAARSAPVRSSPFILIRPHDLFVSLFFAYRRAEQGQLFILSFFVRLREELMRFTYLFIIQSRQRSA